MLECDATMLCAHTLLQKSLRVVKHLGGSRTYMMVTEDFLIEKYARFVSLSAQPHKSQSECDVFYRSLRRWTGIRGVLQASRV